MEAVDVCLDGTWIEVSYRGHYGWVMIRYLSDSKPGPKPTSTPSSKPGSSSSAIDYSKFKSASYLAAVRPSVTSGVVHMRWAPSKSVAIRCDYPEGAVLQVIATSPTWAQVRDADTGAVGFMMLSFLQETTGDGGTGDIDG